MQGRVHKIRAQLVSLMRPQNGRKNQLAGLGGGGGAVSPPEGSGGSPGKFVKFDTFKHFRSSILSILVVIGMFEKMPNGFLRRFKFYWSRKTK